MIQNLLGSIKYLGYEEDTDFVDRIHSFLTTNLLISFAVLVSFKQFGGRPIECMTPDTFTSAMEQYTESYCWSRDTYVLPFKDEVPLTREAKGAKEISYYQWVPFFLLLQALCFRIPSLLWRYTAGNSGIRMHDLVRLALDDKNIDPVVRDTNLSVLAVHIQNALRFHRRLIRRDIKPYRIARCLNLPYSAFYVTYLYLFVKLLYLLNVFAQLYYMNKFLMTDRDGWLGFQSVAHLMNGSSWEMSGVFPRVSLCDVQARVLGGVQLFTIQCVLVINLFNEKIFVFLWIWFAMLMFLTACSFIYWLCVTIMPGSGVRFISRHLELADMPFDPDTSEKQVVRFVSSYLKADGVFVLRMITMHTNIIFGTDLTKKLWDKFYGIEEQVKALTPAIGDGIATAPPLFTGDKHGKNLFNHLRNRANKTKGKPAYDDNQLDILRAREFQDDVTALLHGTNQTNTATNTYNPAVPVSIDMPDRSTDNSFVRGRDRSDSWASRRRASAGQSELKLKIRPTRDAENNNSVDFKKGSDINV